MAEINSERCSRHSLSDVRQPGDSAHCEVCRFKRKARLLLLWIALTSAIGYLAHEVLSWLNG